ncbi:MAG: hypothetical protein WCD02_10490 [Terriglobales bacterium]
MILATAVLTYAMSFIPTTGQPPVTGPVQVQHVRACQYSAQVNYCVIKNTVPGPAVRQVRQDRPAVKHSTK